MILILIEAGHPARVQQRQIKLFPLIIPIRLKKIKNTHV